VTADIARINDVVALKFLPALIGKSKPPSVAVLNGNVVPDFAGVAAAGQLRTAAALLAGDAARAPLRFANAGKTSTEIASTLTAVAVDCKSAASAHDDATLKTLDSRFSSAGGLEATLDKELPHVPCLPGLRAEIQSCQPPKS
jgi:hypothetical protein